MAFHDPVFAQSHPVDLLLIEPSFTGEFYTIPLSYLLNISETTEIQATKVNQVIDHRFVHHPEAPGPSCNGLILIPRVGWQVELTWLLWNPFKDGQLGIFIPPYGFSPAELDDGADNYPYHTGLGYDTATDDYKVVRFAPFRGPNLTVVFKTLIFSVRLGAWHMISDFPGMPAKVYNKKGAAFVNGALHWILDDNDEQGQRSNAMGWMVALDLTTETYRKLQLPTAEKYCFGLDAVGGYLFLSSLIGTTMVNTTWILKDYGAENKWTKLLHMSYYIPNLRPIAYIKSKEQVIVYNKLSRELLWFHVKNNEPLKTVTLPKGIGHEHSLNFQVLPASLNCLHGIGGSASDDRGLEADTKKSNDGLKLRCEAQLKS